jgi:hypothetical protein
LLLQAHDPAFLIDPGGEKIKEENGNISPDRWSFEPESFIRRRKVRKAEFNHADPPNVMLAKPYLSHAVPYQFERGKTQAMTADTLTSANVRLLLRGDIFGEYMTLTQMIELPLNEAFFEAFYLLVLK